ncbi:MAG: efflux transporter outer membrane subunit [Planctomycetota bacterium]|nr:efflux transporter outer membrane subunit [Planctomycetota bacterium]
MNATAVLFAFFALVLPGCSLHDVNESPDLPLALPSQYGAAPDANKSGASPARAAPSPWWRDIKDDRLQDLIKIALEKNYDIRKAWTRLEQSEHLLTQTNAALFPEVSGSADITRSRSVSQFGGFGDQVFLNTQYRVNLSTTYELDIWARALNTRSGNIASLDANRFDIEATALTICGQVAETWIRILEQRSQIDLLERQLQTNKTFSLLIEMRFNQGQNTALDVLQQRQQVASSKTQIPLAKARLGVLEHQLNILLGRAPATTVPRGARFPDVPPWPVLGVPGDILSQRPDVKAAQQRLLAADYQVAVKVAERLPALRLNASAGYQSFELSTLFSNMVANAAAGLTAPLFDAGRRAAAVDQQAAVTKERLQDFGKVALTALKEVEDAVVQERFQERHIVELKEQLALAQQALEEAKNRYRSGLSEYLQVLTSLQAVQRLEQTVFSASRDRLLFRIQLYRALGGSWTKTLEVPEDLKNS